MRSIRILLFALVWFSCAWFGSWELNTNTETRLFASISLGEQHDATIDEFADLTIDKARFGSHYYLDKAPGMTLMAIPAVMIGDWWTGREATGLAKIAGGDFARYLRIRLRIAVAMGPAILTALAAVLLFEMGVGLTGSVGAGVFAALGFALGTPIWGWSTTLLGHAPVAALYVIAIWAVWRGARDATPRLRFALLTGASLGWAVVVEYQAALAGGAIAFWALSRYRRQGGAYWRPILAAAVGGLVALIPLALYNLVAFDTPFKIGYSGVVGWEGMHRGLFGLGWPAPRALLEITFGPTRGIVWVAPILLLAPRGLEAWWGEPDRREWAVMLGAVTMIVLLVNAAYVYWDGGNSTGPRLSMPMVGALALALAPVWAKLRSRTMRLAAAGLLGVSIFLNVAIASADIFAPPIFRFPIWSDVLSLRFANGVLVSIASDWFGWSPWAGLWWWCAVALPMLGWLIRAAARNDPSFPRLATKCAIDR